MPQLRCPQCGAINDTNAPDYPFCVGCQDNLAKCGHCRWFDRESMLCLSAVAAGVFDSAPDATPPCDQHAPVGSLLVHRRGYLPFAIAGALVALLVLVYAVLLLWPTSQARNVKLTLMASTEGAVVGVPYVVTVELRNPTNRVVSGLRLQLSRASLQDFALLKAMPREDVRQQQGANWLALLYPDLQPLETKRIDLHLRPKAAGAYNLRARLVSSSNIARGTIDHGMADLPIVVAKQRPAEDGRDETGRRAVG